MRNVATILSICLVALTGNATAGLDLEPPQFIYHLRVVRVSGEGTDPGAAIGWTEDGGLPVILPDDESWGTPQQLSELARALGGERADAVSGFLVPANQAQTEVVRRVYAGSAVVDGSDLENVWFNIVWTAGTTAGHPGFALDGGSDVPRSWSAAGLAGLTVDDHGNGACE